MYMSNFVQITLYSILFSSIMVCHCFIQITMCEKDDYTNCGETRKCLMKAMAMKPNCLFAFLHYDIHKINITICKNYAPTSDKDTHCTFTVCVWFCAGSILWYFLPKPPCFSAKCAAFDKHAAFLSEKSAKILGL